MLCAFINIDFRQGFILRNMISNEIYKSTHKNKWDVYSFTNILAKFILQTYYTNIFYKYISKNVLQRYYQKLAVLVELLYTRDNAQVVTSLQQTCSNAVPTTWQQDVSHCLFPALLTTCYKVVELNRLVTSCSNNLLSSCNSTICQQVVSDNLVATW
jgi:hypothetical protein